MLVVYSSRLYVTCIYNYSHYFLGLLAFRGSEDQLYVIKTLFSKMIITIKFKIS